MVATDFDSGHELEWGWCLSGESADGQAIEITIGETELSRAEAGVAIGRHPMLCEYVIDDPGVSRRHFRLSRSADGLLVEDVNSLNGTRLDGRALSPFEPVVVEDGQHLTAGRVRLAVSRLADTR
ncbi:MAG: FHA domain-containing protein [Alphaproteobacteria bacterium]|nr:FHA domain-containing protein [Alphaproteobacteria bacterium]